jgi:transposase
MYKVELSGAIIMAETIYIGIDVSKKQLDIAISSNGEFHQISNQSEPIITFLPKLKSLSSVQVIVEATGGLERLLVSELQKANIDVAVLNPKRIRDFAKATGRLAKTDKLDAKILALYGEVIKPEPQAAKDEKRQLLAEYQSRLEQCTQMLTMEKNRFHTAGKAVKKEIQRHIAYMEKHVVLLEKEIGKIILTEPELVEIQAILISAKGIGQKVALALMAHLPELGRLPSKKIAALVGIAPLNRDSGTLRGKRCIWGGRAQIRSVLYMGTLVACKYNPIIKAFYERLIAKGKAKKVAIVACMRKFLGILNAMIKNKTPWISQTA